MGLTSTRSECSCGPRTHWHDIAVSRSSPRFLVHTPSRPRPPALTRYIDLVCGQMIPAVASEGLAETVDAFCEGVGFTPEQTARVFETAREHGLKVRLHADQLSNCHGAALAAQFAALSADHLEYGDEAGVQAIAAAGVVAVLLPGAFYFLRETQRPPVKLLRRYGVPIALATDCNPGTSPLTSLLLTMNMGATLFGLTVDECIAGITREAALRWETGGYRYARGK